MQTSIDPAVIETAFAALAPINQAHERQYPGPAPHRQPIHTVYGGAHLFKADTFRRLGDVALATLRQFAPDASGFAHAIGSSVSLMARVYPRVIEKLTREPVEDYRIDFEDGYGHRPHAEEDAHAVSAGAELGRAILSGSIPPSVGLRIKALSDPTAARAIRTLDLFLTSCLATSNKTLSSHFVVTLPKITSPEQVTALSIIIDAFENTHALNPGAIGLEVMVETPQSLFNAAGEFVLPKLRAAANGRLRSAHLGAYDFTAACDVSSSHQSMRHALCDFARQLMSVAFAGTDVNLSDGATNVLPVVPHRTPQLSPEQMAENRTAVFSAWRLAADDIKHSLVSGYFQGWDLHPAQLPVRYAVTYGFFLENLVAMSQRLRNFVDRSCRASTIGNVFDDAATGQGLLNFFRRGVSCGALDAADLHATGLTLDEVRHRSFAQIVENRLNLVPPSSTPIEGSIP